MMDHGQAMVLPSLCLNPIQENVYILIRLALKKARILSSSMYWYSSIVSHDMLS